MRKLIFIPNVHPEGNRLPIYEEVTESLPKLLEEDIKKIKSFEDKIWSVIEKGVDCLPESLYGMRIFSESVTEDEATVLYFFNEQITALPLESHGSFKRMLKQPTEEELEILKEDGLEGKHIRLILLFMLRGAAIEVTEGQPYKEGLKILQELARTFIESPNQDEPSEPEEELRRNFASNIHDRDREIANNINVKLKEGETGFLFLGLVHDMLDLLDKDIEVELINPELEESIIEVRKEWELKVKKTYSRPESVTNNEYKG